MEKTGHLLFFRRQRLQIVSVVVVLLVTSLMIWNTLGLNRALKESTTDYVKDVSYQLSEEIASRLNDQKSALLQVADSIPRLTEENTEEFLARKAQILNFDAFVLIDPNGNTLPKGFDLGQSTDVSGIQDSFRGESSVGYIEGQNLLLSTPVYRDGEIAQVLVGICKKERIQALIQPKSFHGGGFSCIVDSHGKAVISPTDLSLFLQLEDLFKNAADVKTIDAIANIQKDIKNHESGVFAFTAGDDSPVLLSYHPLEINNYVLLTLVPANLISGETDSYLFRMLLIVGGITLAFALFFVALLNSYRSNRKQLENIAFTDPLTGGPNHVAFRMKCRELAESEPLPSYVIVLLNVKGFKFINETFGLEAGNDTLRYLYRVLKCHIRRDEAFTRGEADHFFLCLKEKNEENIQERLNEMIRDINSFGQQSDIRYQFTILQGACFVTEYGLDISIVQDHARMACQQKEPGKCVFYSAQLAEKMKWEQELNTLFDRSIQDRDFHVYLQPKICLKDDSVCGAEALVRWVHPQHGTIFPSDFIPVFEKSGLICMLDLYVFEEVCRWMKTWIEKGNEPIPISVNLSRMHFRNLNFLRSYVKIKQSYEIPDGLIELEMTESIFFDVPQIKPVKYLIDQMHTSGFLCSLDDFGFGFSSLVLLKEFDVDTVKLDRRFFEDISNRKTQKVISGLVEMIEKLNIHIVAEGIETEDQLAYLRETGCEMVQGYIFSRPRSLSDFQNWYESHTRLSTA